MAGSVRVDGFGVVTAIVPDGPAFVYLSHFTRPSSEIAESTDGREWSDNFTKCQGEFLQILDFPIWGERSLIRRKRCSHD
jgi:hypothetical protein